MTTLKTSFTMLAVILFFAGLVGCGGVRFVVDAVPAQDELTQTTVLEDDGAGWSASKVALIDLDGLIIDARKPGLLAPGENPVSRFVESLRLAGDDASIKAVIVRLNSPGGTVTASDVVYSEVERFREDTGKPVVMLMGDVAASGAFYVACAGDEVIAHPTTVTGSIGVIIQTINFSEGMRRIGIRSESITSGPNKSMGSPFEPMETEHREIFQGLVGEFYGRFVEVVRANRAAVSPADLEWVTDGRVVSGARAAEVGLVDRTGDLHDAFDAAKRLAGVSSARLVKYHRPIEHVGSAYARTPGTGPMSGGGELNLLQVNLDLPAARQPGFYYLWDPAVNW